MQANGQKADIIDDNQTKHALVSSWFLGPRAENMDVLQGLFRQALERQKQTRVELADDEKDQYFFITEEMKKLDIYKQSIHRLTNNSKGLSNMLAKHSVPFWSPRYNAHMNMDTTLASVIGYMSAMIYNPNNVATEASPYTTEVERQVGQELCEMLGYNSPDKNPAPWGHITCKHGLCAVTWTYSSADVGITTWENSEGGVTVGSDVGAAQVAEAGPKASWFRGASSSGWSTWKDQKRVVFFAGIKIKTGWFGSIREEPEKNWRGAGDAFVVEDDEDGPYTVSVEQFGDDWHRIRKAGDGGHITAEDSNDEEDE